MKLLSTKLGVLALLLLPALAPSLHAQPKSTWRSATSAELRSALPARAQVEKERIETEMRTASGIINPQGKIVAGVVLITAGYSADGKYSHYFLVQAPVTIGDVSLPAGNYVFGWQRNEESLIVKFYDAATGEERGTTAAHRLPTGSRVESLRIWPPSEHQFIQIGRFALSFSPGS